MFAEEQERGDGKDRDAHGGSGMVGGFPGRGGVWGRGSPGDGGSLPGGAPRRGGGEVAVGKGGRGGAEPAQQRAPRARRAPFWVSSSSLSEWMSGFVFLSCGPLQVRLGCGGGEGTAGQVGELWVLHHL